MAPAGPVDGGIRVLCLCRCLICTQKEGQTLAVRFQKRDDFLVETKRNKHILAGYNVAYRLVSQARPSHSAAFSSFRINTRGEEGLAHCLYPFGSARQDLVWPIRLKHALYVTLSYVTRELASWTYTRARAVGRSINNYYVVT